MTDSWFEQTRAGPRLWLILLVLCAASIGAFVRFTRPQLQMLRLSAGRDQAAAAAERHLTDVWGQNPSSWRRALIFQGDDQADQFLQKALGFDKEADYLKKHGKELFVWKIRFFKELQKEEFIIDVSAADGRVVGHTHIIPDSEARPLIDRATARALAERFLEQHGVGPLADARLFVQSSRRYDRRIDHFFQWEQDGTQIPWITAGGMIETARIVNEALVSGREIRAFTLKRFLVPDTFRRFLERLRETGRNLSQLFMLFYFLLLSAAVYLVMVKRQHTSVRIVKTPALIMTGVLFCAIVALRLNAWDTVMYHYPTTSPWTAYSLRQIIDILNTAVLVTVTFLMPFLAGEALHGEMFPDRPAGRAAFYIMTKNWWRHRSLIRIILLGYMTAVIMIGIQSTAFAVGQKWMGVWIQHSWLTQFSNNRFPALSSALAAILAAFSEEASFRLFGITWGVKFFKRTVPAVVVSSLLWGLGHTHYLVFPMWFRTLEVGLMGLFLGWTYLRFGLIPVIIGHYAFDVFWSSCPYLLGMAGWGGGLPHYAALCWPLLLLIPAGLFPTTMTSTSPARCFHPAQQLNLAILTAYLRGQNLDPQARNELRKRLLSIHWDPLVVDKAFEAAATKSLKNE